MNTDYHVQRAEHYMRQVATLEEELRTSYHARTVNDMSIAYRNQRVEQMNMLISAARLELVLSTRDLLTPMETV